MSLEIRRPRSGDLDAIVSIENAAFLGDRLSRRSLRRLTTSTSVIFCVAEDDARIVGYAVALVRRTSRIGRLYSIAIDPSVSGRGVASALLRTIEGMVAQTGKCLVRLEVREDNLVAIRLYERAGYRQFGRYENYYQDGMDALRFEKVLHPMSKENGPR